MHYLEAVAYLGFLANGDSDWQLETMRREGQSMNYPPRHLLLALASSPILLGTSWSMATKAAMGWRREGEKERGGCAEEDMERWEIENMVV